MDAVPNINRKSAYGYNENIEMTMTEKQRLERELYWFGKGG